MKMYDNYSDLYVHTSDDRLARWLKEMDFGALHEEASIQLYAVLHGILSNRITIDDFEDLIDPLWPSIVFEVKSLLEICAVSDKTEVMLFINNVMHIMHTANPDLREMAVECLCEEILPDLRGGDYSKIVYLNYWGYHLTGKSAVPEEFQEKIKEVVSKYGCACDIRMSWAYSHLDCGDSYGYDRDEDISVTVYFCERESFDLVEKELKSLKLVRGPGF